MSTAKQFCLPYKFPEKMKIEEHDRAAPLACANSSE